MAHLAQRRRLLFAVLTAAVWGLAWNVGLNATQRIRPPDSVKCPRNHLTSFTGTILSYSRALGRTEIRIRTDEETTEKFVLQHPKSEDPSLWFLLRGIPFQGPDWAAIESEKGRLRPNTRATVWVCDDGSNPMVDWRPPH